LLGPPRQCSQWPCYEENRSAARELLREWGRRVIGSSPTLDSKLFPLLSAFVCVTWRKIMAIGYLRTPHSTARRVRFVSCGVSTVFGTQFRTQFDPCVSRRTASRTELRSTRTDWGSKAGGRG
jgi:hypothetical protein